MAVILFFVIVGLTKADTCNLSPLTPLGTRRIFSASAILFFAYVNFNVVSSMVEENRKPVKDIPHILVGMRSYNEIDPDAPFSIAFSTVSMD
ncbi:Cationic amino acid transporter 1 [Platanthera guangdongensis]|uniref:Cationic amino acid transporter 1 n=1 Tax=Platanthera guangdongensis TaxID=2320717 RepID=A0ABR2MNR6_9ASPA